MKALCISIAFLALLVGMVGCSKPSITSPATEAASTTTPMPIASTPSIASAVAKVNPAVVRVVTDKGMGSGIIIDKQGYVLTNSHVVEGSQSIKVVLADKREYPASVIGRDEIKDLAILKISATNLPVVTLGNSEKLTPGDEVMAIGYPLDLTGSATISRGIVSAFRNDNEIGLIYIQTDASINPGSSGGALINSAGEVVGINVMTIRVAGGIPIEGMNFAIAINSAKPIIPKLIAGESILKPTPAPETWKTYTNDAYGYSIQYPSAWTLTVDKTSPFAGQVIIDSPGTARIVINRVEALGTTVSHYVDVQINGNSKVLPVYRVLSRTDLMWQGVYQACEWTLLHQPGVGYPLLKSRNLYLEYKGYFYSISGLANESDYESYSSTIDTIINSFHLDASNPSSTPTTTPWKTYFNPVYPYSVEYPSDWAVKDSDKSILSLNNPYGVWVGVTAFKNLGVSSLRDYIAWAIGWKTNNLKDFLLISSKQITQQGQDAWELSYSQTLGGSTYLVKVVVVSTPSQFYEVSSNVPSTSSKDYSPILDKIIASFRLTD